MAKIDDKIVRKIEETKNKSKSSKIVPLILCFLVAIALWFYVVSVETPTHEKTFSGVPITVMQPTGDLSVYSGYSSTVDIKISGKRSELNSLSIDDFTATVDLSTYDTAGKYSVPIAVTVPDGMTYISKSIDNLSVYLDIKTSASVPVVVNVSDYSTASGLELGSQDEIKKSVNEITLTGPQMVLETVAQASVNLSLGKVDKSVKASAPIVLVDKDGLEIANPYVVPDVTTVDVDIPLYTTKTLKTTVEFKNGFLSSENCKVSIEPASVTVRGRVEELNDLDKISIATIDEKSLATNKINTQIKLPDGMMLSGGGTTADISFSYVNSTTTTVTADITVNNPNSLSYTLDSDSMNVILRGAGDLLSSIKEGDVSLNVDLSFQNAGAGKLTLPVKVKLSSAFADKVYEIGDYNVSVTIH